MDTTTTRLLAKTNPNLREDMLKAARVAEAKHPTVNRPHAMRAAMEQEQIRQDVLAVNFRIQETDARLIDWTRAQLLRFGFTGAAADLTRTTLSAYAKWIAHEILGKGTPGDLPFSAFLDGQNELDYWRAIAIAATKGQATK